MSVLRKSMQRLATLLIGHLEVRLRQLTVNFTTLASGGIVDNLSIPLAHLSDITNLGTYITHILIHSKRFTGDCTLVNCYNRVAARRHLVAFSAFIITFIALLFVIWSIVGEFIFLFQF
jgi:hypothetical protein